MRQAKEIIPGAAARLPSVMIKSPRQIDPATAEVVNRLFAELQCIFPAWRQAWPDNKALAAAKRSWIKGFAAAGINTLEQIRFGLGQCRQSGSDFAPSIGRFIQWCKPTPELLGLPSADAAYREACRKVHPAFTGNWSHQAVYHAACQTGFYELDNLPEERSRKLFDRNYGATVEMVMAGEPLREIPKALPASVSTCTPEVGRNALAGLREALKRQEESHA